MKNSKKIKYSIDERKEELNNFFIEAKKDELKYPEIKLIWLQVKSEKKLKRLCKLLSILEEEYGIKETRITFDDVFVCPRIDIDILRDTEMEGLVKWLIISK